MEYLISVTHSDFNITKHLTTYQEPFIGQRNEYHYIYEIYVPYTGWIYCGVRSNKDWTTDDYMGSSRYDTFIDDCNKCGIVYFKILRFFETRSEAEDAEIKLVNKDFIKQPKVYNIVSPRKRTGTYGCIIVKWADGRDNKNFIIKHDDPRWHNKEVISIRKGKKMPKEAIIKIANSNKGRKRSDEVKQKMSNSSKGKHKSLEHGKNISIAKKGNIMSEEQKRQISKTLKGRKLSDTTKEKISNGIKGKLKDNNIYIFYNEELNIIEECTRLEILNKYTLNRSCITAIINGNRDHHKGWKFKGIKENKLN